MSFSSASSASGKKGKMGQNWESELNLVYPNDRTYYAIVGVCTSNSLATR